MSGEMNEPSAREQRVNEAIAAYLEAMDAGEAPDPKEFIAAHGDISAELNSFFTNRAEFERMAEPLQPAGGAGTPQAQHDDVTLPPASEPTETPTIAPTIVPERNADAAIGTMVRYFGDYELVEEIARGGMGVVYKARQVSLNRIVALKMILAGQLASEEDVQRFHAEAEAAANLDHPGIVPIYEVGEHEGQHYFSMGFVEGSSLSAKVADGPLTPKEAAEYTKKVAEAVAYAHEKGVIHRDLKPANVLLQAEDTHASQNTGTPDLQPSAFSLQPKVTDFGLAKKVEGDSGLTATGQILGTPGYMPPEQASGKIGEVSETADIYSLGAILYCLLTSRPPFQADNPLDTLMQVLEREPVSPRQLNPNVPQDLETICLKCLEKDRHRRYASAQALADELQRFLNDEPIQARPISAPARAWRWCKRKPGLAGLWVAVTLLLLTLSIGGPVVAYKQADLRGQAEGARAQAEGKRQEAEQESRRAYRSYYAAQMNLAQRDWEIPAIASLLDRLTATRPQGTGGHDFRRFEWHYWDRLCHCDLMTRKALVGFVWSVAFNPDGQRIAVGGTDGSHGTVVVWDTATGQQTLTLKHARLLYGVAFSPDGKRIASASSDGLHGTVKVWDSATGQETLTLKGHRGRVFSVSFSPDGKRIVSGGGGQPEQPGQIKVWDASSGQETLTLKGHTSPVTSVSFSPDGQRIASASLDTMVKVWDAATGQEMLSLKGHSGEVKSVSFSPDGQRIASASSDTTVKVWDAATGQKMFTLKGHSGEVTSVSFSPDGQRITSGSDDNTVKVWEAATGRETLTLKGHRGRVSSVSFSPDGKRIASGSSDHTVKLWDATTDQETLTVKGHRGSVHSVSFSPDGQRIASASDDTTVKVWDAATGQETLTLRGHTGRVSGVSFSPDGQRIASASWDNTVKLWDAATGRETLTLKGHTGFVASVSFSPDGQRIASGSWDRTVKLWDATTGQETRTLRGQRHGVANGVRSAAFSPDGKRLASASADKTVKVWDVATGQETLTLKGHTSGVTSVSFSPDGQRIATASGDATVKVWDAATGQETLTLRGHRGTVFSVAFSLDGQRIVSGSWDNTVKLWDAATGQETLTLKGHTLVVMSVSFSPDGQRIASGSIDNTVKVWDAHPRERTNGAASNTSAILPASSKDPELAKQHATAGDGATDTPTSESIRIPTAGRLGHGLRAARYGAAGDREIGCTSPSRSAGSGSVLVLCQMGGHLPFFALANDRAR